MTPDLGPLPPSAVRASFALFLGVVVLSLLNAVIQVAFRISGTTVLLGAMIETFLLLFSAARCEPAGSGRGWR